MMVIHTVDMMPESAFFTVMFAVMLIISGTEQILSAKPK